MVTDRSFARWRHADALALLVLVIVAAAIRIWFFRGLMGSDDSIYATRGLEIASGLWLESTYIGALRYGVNLPIAAAVHLLGRTEGALAVWGLVCSLVEIAIVYAFALRAFGTRVAICACLVLATIPQHIDSATNIGADAPFSALLTTAMVFLYFGAQSPGRNWLLAAGFACGFSGWVKPEPAVVFSLAFAVMAFATLQDRRRLVWLVVGGGIAAALNLALFAWAFGDPLYYVHAGARNLKANFVEHTAPWGVHEGSFYFRLLFLDGRAFWISPFLAVVGGWVAYREATVERLHAARFTIVWVVLLLLFFSFFVYSLSPFRLIPKQTNYALIFAAPIALLAGIALARSPRSAAYLLIALLSVGGMILAALDGFGRDFHAETHYATIRFAREHKSAAVFAADQSINLNNVVRLMGKDYASNLRPLNGVVEALVHDNSLPAGIPIFAAFHSAWPEGAGKVGRLVRGGGARCLQKVAEAVGENGPTYRLVARVVIAVRAVLPPWADRHMRFTDSALKPEPVRFYSVDRRCLIDVAEALAHMFHPRDDFGMSARNWAVEGGRWGWPPAV